MQCRLSIETRTNAYQVRTGEFPEEQLSVYVTARRYGGWRRARRTCEVLETLTGVCHEMIDHYVADNVLQPLARSDRHEIAAAPACPMSSRALSILAIAASRRDDMRDDRVHAASSANGDST